MKNLDVLPYFYCVAAGGGHPCFTNTCLVLVFEIEIVKSDIFIS